MTYATRGTDGKTHSHSLKVYAIFMALLVGTLFPIVAQAERFGTPVEVWNLHLGAFDWKINSTPQPDGTVHFHIVLTISHAWPEVSLTHGPSATLSRVWLNSRQSYQVGKDLRPLKLKIVGKTAQCDFAVTKEELADPNLCFAFSLWGKEKKENADFALLNDFYDFPTSALARLADAKADDRRRVAQKLALACSINRGAVDWEKVVPSLIPYLNDHDVQVQESILEALVKIRKPADKIVPALVQVLDTHARAKFRDTDADERIVHDLEEIEPRWYDRPEFKFNEKVRKYVEDIPQNLD